MLICLSGGFAQQGTSNIEFVENKGQWDPRVKFRGGDQHREPFPGEGRVHDFIVSSRRSGAAEQRIITGRWQAAKTV
jgi:hypothetical protein